MYKVMFVCTGNICRSPMAEYYMEKKLNDLNKNGAILVNSCGTSANTGEIVSNDSVEAMKEYGVDLKDHKAKSVFDVDIMVYDLILTMSTSHKQYIKTMFPDLEDRVFTLLEYSSNKPDYLDIDDPYGFDIEVYRDVAAKIVGSIDIVIKKI